MTSHSFQRRRFAIQIPPRGICVTPNDLSSHNIMVSIFIVPVHSKITCTNQKVNYKCWIRTITTDIININTKLAWTERTYIVCYFTTCTISWNSFTLAKIGQFWFVFREFGFLTDTKTRADVQWQHIGRYCLALISNSQTVPYIHSNIPSLTLSLICSEMPKCRAQCCQQWSEALIWAETTAARWVAAPLQNCQLRRLKLQFPFSSILLKKPQFWYWFQ